MLKIIFPQICLWSCDCHIAKNYVPLIQQVGDQNRLRENTGSHSAVAYKLTTVINIEKLNLLRLPNHQFVEFQRVLSHVTVSNNTIVFDTRKRFLIFWFFTLFLFS